MIAVVLADKNWGIAKDGKQIAYIKEDLEQFKKITLGQTVIFGRKTLETFPDGKPLKHRNNICLSRTLKSEQDLKVIHNVDEIDFQDHICTLCIGGESVYRQLYQNFTGIYVTRLQEDLHADQFFPLDVEEKWVNIYDNSDYKYDPETGLHYKYELYLRKV